MLPVYYEERLVGTIEAQNVGLAFAYGPDWIAATDGYGISLTMPLQAQSFPSGVATPWFANLLPEDRLLEQVGRLLGRSEGDVYGLVEEMGRETAGALSIGGPESTEHAGYRQLDEVALADVIARLPARPLLIGEPEVTMSLAGAQTKLAVAVFDDKVFLPLRGAASTHILKPASERFHATVENELLCMRLARSLGLPVAQVAMGLAGEKPYLLVQRYDRHMSASGKVTRTHQEDFCQALGRYPTQKYEARRGPGLSEMFGLLSRHSRLPARDRLNLLDLVVFGCCIGDTDRHAKNYSIQLSERGARLAPGYDFLSALIYDGVTKNLAMKIAGKTRAGYLERRHWERFARDVGLSPAATVRRVEALAKAASATVPTVVDDLASSYPLNRQALDLLAAAVREQAGRIAANCRKGPAADLNNRVDEDADE